MIHSPSLTGLVNGSFHNPSYERQGNGPEVSFFFIKKVFSFVSFDDMKQQRWINVLFFIYLISDIVEGNGLTNTMNINILIQ